VLSLEHEIILIFTQIYYDILITQYLNIFIQITQLHSKNVLQIFSRNFTYSQKIWISVKGVLGIFVVCLIETLFVII